MSEEVDWKTIGNISVRYQVGDTNEEATLRFKSGELNEIKKESNCDIKIGFNNRIRKGIERVIEGFVGLDKSRVRGVVLTTLSGEVREFDNWDDCFGKIFSLR